MRLLKSILLSLVFLPLFSFANSSLDADEDLMFAADRSFPDVPLLCYAGFRAVIEMLPELTNQLNIKAGSTIVVIDNVNTPNGYNTVFEWDVLKAVNPKSVGHYTLQQVYTAPTETTKGTLYVNFTTKVPGQIDNVWKLVDAGMAGCAANLPDKPSIPGIPG